MWLFLSAYESMIVKLKGYVISYLYKHIGWVQGTTSGQSSLETKKSSLISRSWGHIRKMSGILSKFLVPYTQTKIFCWRRVSKYFVFVFIIMSFVLLLSWMTNAGRTLIPMRCLLFSYEMPAQFTVRNCENVNVKDHMRKINRNSSVCSRSDCCNYMLITHIGTICWYYCLVCMHIIISWR